MLLCIVEVLNSQNMSRFIYIVSIYGMVYIFNQGMYTILNIMEKVTSLFGKAKRENSRIIKKREYCHPGHSKF